MTGARSCRPTGIVLASLVVAQACAPAESSWTDLATATRRAGTAIVLEVEPRDVLATIQGTKVYGTGYGSGLAVDERTRTIYLLTDRGPNVDGAKPNQKLFPVPSYTPEIGCFKVRSGRLVRTGRIPLRDATGKRISGLPNLPGRGGTGEIPVGPDGKSLAPDPNGLDPEALVRLEDGSFWVSDEYGPHLVHVDRGGRTLERINPYSGKRKLPAVFASRRPNRGMEGLGYLDRESTLVAFMQSPLDNPIDAGRKSRFSRILFFHLPSGSCRQFLYPLDDPSDMVSDVVAVAPTRFLALEIDTKFPHAPTDPSKQCRVYVVDVEGATDVNDPSDGGKGFLVSGKTIEEASASELEAARIVTASKQLFCDLLDPAVDYRHNKAEGLALLRDGAILVANDDDFGIDDDGRGGLIPKRNPATGGVDRNRVYVIRPPTASLDVRRSGAEPPR